MGHGRHALATIARLTTLAMLVAGLVLSSTVTARAAVTLTKIGTTFNAPIGVDYHEPTNKLLMSVYYSSGFPHNFELVAQDGTRTTFTSISRFTDEVYISTVRSGPCHPGFTVGEAFVGNGNPGQIVRISPDGNTVINPWVTLPGDGGLLRGGLFQDRYCAFGGDLIATSTSGNVWRITSAGVATKVATIAGGSENEGPTTAPINPTKYGPWSGTILVTNERNGCVYSVTSIGGVTCYHFFQFNGGDQPESIRIIPANENFFGVGFSDGALYGATADQFTSMVGDVLLAIEFPGNLIHIHWNGTAFTSEKVAQVTQWEGTTFAPVGVVNLPPPNPQPATLTLSPATATNQVGTQHCVTATVKDSSGGVVANTKVDFSVSGTSSASGTVTTDAIGQAKFCYSSTKTGTDTITAAAQSGTKPTATAHKTWTAGPPATVTVAPPTAINVVGNSHTVTATVKDSFGNPVPGVTVAFTVTGANPTSGTATTNANGQASFTYTGTNFGADTIKATAGTVSGLATKTWKLAQLDHFKCYSVDAAESDLDRTVILTDQFGTSRAEVEEPKLLCNPVNKNNEGIITPTAHLLGYEIDTKPESRDHLVEVTNQFGTERLWVEKSRLLAEPASKALPGQALGRVPITLNNFECYSVEGKTPRPPRNVTLVDEFGTEHVTVKRPVLLCNPVQKNQEKIGPVIKGPEHLVCYAISPREHMAQKMVMTRDQFGVQHLRVKRSEMLCVPSDKEVLRLPSGDWGDHGVRGEVDE